ncbi:hypothetical protein CN918_25475 [Priestia megaterium]|nr:hypothetical protein CN918_25475 [Priestia megaterium]
MDKVDGNEPKKMSIDEAFKEALALSEGAECSSADRDKTILQAIKQSPELISQFSLEFKLEIITDWDYEVTFW